MKFNGTKIISKLAKLPLLFSIKMVLMKLRFMEAGIKLIIEINMKESETR